MNRPSASANTEAYFENKNRDQNVDFTEVLNFEGAAQEITKDVQENPSDAQRNYMKKMEVMLNYRRELFLNHLSNAQEKSYIELNVKYILILFVYNFTFFRKIL